MRLAITLFCIVSTTAGADDWRQWRGPSGQNHAADGATAPDVWSETSNLAWRTKVPGRGHSSPVIVGERIYLTTCDERLSEQSLLVFDRKSGKLLKQTVAHSGKLPQRIHDNNTHASPTVAGDGQNVFALFHNDRACWLTKFDLEGNQIWQRRVAGFEPKRYQYGLGTSPVSVDDLLVVSAEYDGPDSGLYGVSAQTGELVWHAARPKDVSFSTPIAAMLDGRKQLIMSGNWQIASYDPATGAELWSTRGSTHATCGTMVWDAQSNLAFASGGFPDAFTLAVRGDGNNDIVWQTNKVRCYEQSLLYVDGYLYAVTDNGIAHCLRAIDGQVMWKERIGGRYSSSPLYVDGKVYVSNERGTTFVFRASPDGYQQIAENQLGDECYATTTPVGGKLYHRYAKREGGRRQEYLVAIGE
jgi:outer membrane protein assembly factor BamB